MDLQSPVRPSLVVVGSRRVVSEDNEARRSSSSGSGKSGNQRSARSLLLSPLQKSKSRLSSLIHSPSLRKKGKSLLMVGRGKSSPKQPRQHDPNNVLHWLEDSCPLEIVSQVLACSGPQMAATLSRTNKFWHQVLQEESTWRTMCEALYKVRETTQAEIPHHRNLVFALFLTMECCNCQFCAVEGRPTDSKVLERALSLLSLRSFGLPDHYSCFGRCNTSRSCEGSPGSTSLR